MTSDFYEGWVRARAVLDDHDRTHHVVDEIVITRRRGMRYLLGQTLVSIGTQLMGAGDAGREIRRAA
jgi:hypothetical protein